MVPPFRIEEILNNEDGTDTVVMDLSDEFVSFFCDLKGIQEFDKELFNEWFLEAIQTAVDAHRAEKDWEDDNEIPNR
jgi:hypothetical protein